MGYYINENSNGAGLPPNNKADYLILDGAVEIPKPDKWVPNLVCVLHNGIFSTAINFSMIVNVLFVNGVYLFLTPQR